jgi:iron complex transport system permease protein
MEDSNIGSKKNILTAALLFMPVVFILLSLCIGRYPLSPVKILQILREGISPDSNTGNDLYHSIVWQIRMPRAILGGLVGGALGISGAALQGLFKNPLVSPGILGVSSGAGFGAAIAILISGATAVIYPFALFFGILAVFFSYLIGRTYNTAPTIMLVLGGVIVSSMFSALISFAKYIAEIGRASCRERVCQYV